MVRARLFGQVRRVPGGARRWWQHVAVATAFMLALAGGGAAGIFAGPSPASGAVEHGQGFAAVVDGYRGWFGSYRLEPMGEVWCVDHGIAAPDAALAYEPTGLDDRAPETRRAVAWAVGRFGVAPDRVGAAAIMLALHDLMGAVYPSGPLSVDGLSVDQLQGFGASAGAVLERARAIKADAVSRAGLVGPLSMTVSVEGELVAGRNATLRAAVVDAAGAPIAGVVIHPAVTGAALTGDVDLETGSDGSAVWPFEVGPGENRFALSASVPGAELVALRPTRGAAQRVARPSSLVVTAETSFDGLVPRTLTIVKRGDAEPELAVTGARFAVSGIEGELVVGPDGRTPPLTVLPGTYVVTEVAAPPGYDAGGPWHVTVTDADVTLEVENRARRGWLDISKVDAVTGAVVDGATFAVTGPDGAAVTDPAAALLVGRYDVKELTAPPHYRLQTEPVAAEVRAGERTAVTVPNVALATIGFEKHPALAGATFAVRRDAGTSEEGRCTTGVDGRCALAADALEAGRSYCWTEVEAPPGWGLADGGCVTTGPAGSLTVVAVDEPPLPPPPAPLRPASAPTPTPTPTGPPSAPEPAPVTPPATILDSPTFERPTRPISAPELPRTGASAAGLAALGVILIAAGALVTTTSRSSGALGRQRRPSNAASRPIAPPETRWGTP